MNVPRLDGRIDERDWKQAARVSQIELPDGGPASSRTTLWLGHDDGYLYVAVRCEEKNTAALQRCGNQAEHHIWLRDHVELYLDTRHDHSHYCQFCFAPFEQCGAYRGALSISHRDGPGSLWVRQESQVAEGMYCRFATSVEEGVAWSMEAAIPFESLGAEAPAAGAVWGLNLARFTAWPTYQGAPTAGPWPNPQSQRAEWSMLSLLPGHLMQHPFVYADMTFDEPAAIQLLDLDFGTPHFGENRGRARFKTPQGAAGLTVSTCVRSRKNGKVIDPVREIPLAPSDRGTACADLLWKAKHYDDDNSLEVVVRRSAGGEVAWRGSYDFGWEQGALPLGYLYKGESGRTVPNPDPADPEFLMKKGEYIASRQHRLFRRSTASGTPSDFTLESADGSVQFNLMDPACIPAMARYVHDCYDTEADRLVGMMFFCSQSAIWRAHTAFDSAASQRMETLSLLRFGSGHCAHVGRILAVILNHMESGEAGRLHRARSFGIGGHVIAFAEYRGDYVPLDATHATLFYRLDNRDLATLQEIRREPEIARRAYPFSMPALMAFNAEYLPIHPLDELDGLGIMYPPDARTS